MTKNAPIHPSIASMRTCARRTRAYASVEHAGYMVYETLTSDGSRPLAPPVRYCGVTRLLRQVCCPTYDYKLALAAAGLPKDARVKTGLRSAFQGRTRGELAHKQACVIVNSSGPDQAHAALSAAFGPERSLNAFNMLASLPHRGLRPVVAEFVDYYESVRMASAIDLLCVDRRGRLVLIEMKNGGDNTFFDSNDTLKAPHQLRHRGNSQFVQACLQLALYRQMIVDHYPHVPLGKCYVVQVRHTDTLYHVLPSEFVDAGAALRDALLARRAAKLKPKRKKAQARQ